MAGFERPVILCVDDSEAGLSLRKAVLEKAGYSVFIAREAEEAISICTQRSVALVIADHMLTGLTGVELSAQLKLACPRVPILMVSGTMPETLQHIDCFLDKGEPVQIMLAMVHDLVERQRA